MGEEIKSSEFSSKEFSEFTDRLRQETEVLQQRMQAGHFHEGRYYCGFESEAWLIDKNYHPAAANHRLLSIAKHPLLDSELSKFNFEINSAARLLENSCFSQAQRELQLIWQHCRDLCEQLDLQAGLFGILPTLELEDLSLDNISKSNRYTALNQQVINQRKGQPLKIDINGQQHLTFDHYDVMLESATTSFQLHFQVPYSRSVEYFNATLQASAATVGIAANSCYLFNKLLFAETRIPLFEQAVSIGGYADAVYGPLRRVGFGSSYLRESVIELFLENLNHYPPLLATLYDSDVEEFKHLRLHNGTIWRWNRPLIGFNGEQQPHVRIEHRVLPAGPTIADMFANAALYFGLTHYLAQEQNHLCSKLDFAQCKDNFYKAAQHGLDARVYWPNIGSISLKKLLDTKLIPYAREGLQDLGINDDDINYYIDILKGRCETGQTGSSWQQQYVQRTGSNMQMMTEAYLHNQQFGEPVHSWELPQATSSVKQPTLHIFDKLPDGFLDVAVSDLYQILPGPSLFILKGHKEEGMFLSVLQHGNEHTGFLAAQEILRKYQQSGLPKTLYLFIGNIEAARYGLRRLPDQVDYNRVWPGTDHEECAETKLLVEVMDTIRDKPLAISVDLHNNNGLNPHYACVNYLKPEFLHLALLFSRTVVYFTRPNGVQSKAFAELCPAVTIECGKAGEHAGTEHAVHFLELCLNLNKLPTEPVAKNDIDLYHTVAQVKIPEKIRFSFGGQAADIHFDSELEFMNFRDLTAGTPIADCRPLQQPPFIVIGEDGEDVYSKYFYIKNGLLRAKRAFMPSMLTLNEQIIRQDCFCYLMERIHPQYKRNPGN